MFAALAPYLPSIVTILGVGGVAAIAGTVIYQIVRAIMDKQVELGGASEREKMAKLEAQVSQKVAADTKEAMDIRHEADTKPFNDVVDDL